MQESIVIFFRSQDRIYRDLMWDALDDIALITGCQKPCVFRKYSFSGEKGVSWKIIISTLVLYHCPEIPNPFVYSRMEFLSTNVSQATSLKSDHFIFSLIAFSNFTNIETEHLIYPLSQLVVLS